MSRIFRFVSKAMRLTKRKAEHARQAVLDLELPEQAETEILVTIQRYESDGQPPQWSFNMISPAQCVAVDEAIGNLPNPHLTRRVFFYALTHFETNTGVVCLTREEIAERVGVEPNHVSEAMGRLEKIGAIVRERVKVHGMKGPGKAQYRLNPHVGWKGSLDVQRETAKREVSPMEVIDGGVA